MPKTLNATEAVRSFSEILSSVKYRHESYTIMRGGKPAAVLVPVETAVTQKTLRELGSIVGRLPKLGKDIDAFLQDIEEGIRLQPQVPESSAWE